MERKTVRIIRCFVDNSIVTHIPSAFEPTRTLAAQRAAGLTRQLLIFSRGQTFEAVPVNLTTAVRQIDTFLKRLVGLSPICGAS